MPTKKIAWLLAASLATSVSTGASGCGSDNNNDTSSGQATSQTPAQSSLANFRGVYVATLKDPALNKAAGPRAHWPTGQWSMAIGTDNPNELAFHPGDFQLSVVDLKNGRITFAPDHGCDTPKGRSKNSVFNITRTTTGVRFTAVTPSCQADAAVLTLGDWRGPATSQ